MALGAIVDVEEHRRKVDSLLDVGRDLGNPDGLLLHIFEESVHRAWSDDAIVRWCW